MFRFPYFGYQYNNPYYRYYPKYNNNIKNEYSKESLPAQNSSIIDSNESHNTAKDTRYIDNSEQAIFEILGIKLFLDDIIILGLLFFLYKEDVKDEMLYIILFLLLFS